MTLNDVTVTQDDPREKLRLRAEAETAEREGSRRPTWAPALVLDGELLDVCPPRNAPMRHGLPSGRSNGLEGVMVTKRPRVI
jgi:hypothetical protein